MTINKFLEEHGIFPEDTRAWDIAHEQIRDFTCPLKWLGYDDELNEADLTYLKGCVDTALYLIGTDYTAYKPPNPKRLG